MSIIEQQNTDLAGEEAQAAKKKPFSWQAAEERARQRRLANNRPSARDLAILEGNRAAYKQADEAERLRQIQENQPAIELLQELRQGDPEEQRTVLEYLMQVLDEDRYSSRKLFP